MQRAFDIVEKLENPALESESALIVTRAFIQTILDALRAGKKISDKTLEAAEFSLDELAVKFENHVAVATDVIREIAGMGRGATSKSVAAK